MKTIRNVILSSMLWVALAACSKEQIPNTTIRLPKASPMNPEKTVDILTHSADYSEENQAAALRWLAPQALSDGLYADSLLACSSDVTASAKFRGACILLLSQMPNLNSNTGLRTKTNESIIMALTSQEGPLIDAAAAALLSRPDLARPSIPNTFDSALVHALERDQGRTHARSRQPAESPWEESLRGNTLQDCSKLSTWWQESNCWRVTAAKLTSEGSRGPLPGKLREGFIHFQKVLPKLATLFF